MASATGAVWAIDIGNNSLKALHLSIAGGAVEVIGFDNIQHGKIISGSGVKPAERDELVALSLRRFVEQNGVGKDEIIISVPSKNSFARFVTLPPVERRRIPEIVRFEAAQQIPFDIDDVQWDWQMMEESGSPETKVGIFAIRNDVVGVELAPFGGENLQVNYVQMAPMALYNYILYDRPELCRSDKQAVVVLNIGAENTDLVVCTKSTVWQRNIPMGGNAFTRAIADTFKLNFQKAEKLKRTAAMSKYARQIFQAMRPVFADLASEIQRSLGFYTSSTPNVKLSRIIALGGGTKMRGLLKYLQQTFQIPIERPDSFKRLSMGSDVSAAKFHDSVCDFGVVYGLGLQGLGLGRIESNLLPRSISRSMAWKAKARSITVAACLLLVVSLLAFGRGVLDRVNYNNKQSIRQKNERVVQDAREAKNNAESQKSQGEIYEAMIQKQFDLFKYREVLPELFETIISNLPNEENNLDQKELYRAFADGDVKTILQTPRKERKQIFITGMSAYFVGDVNSAKFIEEDLQAVGRAGKAAPTMSAGVSTAAMSSPWFYPDEYLEEMGIVPGAGTGTDKSAAGFLVTVIGYSPYKNIGELLEPLGVENDTGRWGFVTRLMHLDDVGDGNSPFELYGKADMLHFNLKITEIGGDEDMPRGIGVLDAESDATKAAETVSVKGVNKEIWRDSMTNEIISKFVEIDDDGKPKIDRYGREIVAINDHWFRLDAKFVWRDAPDEVRGVGTAGALGAEMMLDGF